MTTTVVYVDSVWIQPAPGGWRICGSGRHGYGIQRGIVLHPTRRDAEIALAEHLQHHGCPGIKLAPSACSGDKADTPDETSPPGSAVGSRLEPPPLGSGPPTAAAEVAIGADASAAAVGRRVEPAVGAAPASAPTAPRNTGRPR